MKDFMEPSLIVVGGDDRETVSTIASMYEGLGQKVERVGMRTAEMIKYAWNAFHVVKVGFANKIGSLYRVTGVNGGEVMRVLCENRKLNDSSSYLKPGFAFGGSCLLKHLRTLNVKGKQVGLDTSLLSNVPRSNEADLESLGKRVFEIQTDRLGIYGLAFKENADDLRESPVLRMSEILIAHGGTVRIFGPYFDLAKVSGAKQRYLLQTISPVGRLMAANVNDLLDWSQTIVLTQRPSLEMANILDGKNQRIVDFSA